MSCVRRSRTLSLGRVGTTIRTERSATSVRGRPKCSAPTPCSWSGPTTRVSASDTDSAADVVETPPAVGHLLERRGPNRDGLRAHVDAAEALVEMAGGRVVAQDPHDHVRQLHLPQRAGDRAHQLAAVALPLGAIEDVDRIELAGKSRLPGALAPTRRKADNRFILVDHEHPAQAVADDASPAVGVRLLAQRG